MKIAWLDTFSGISGDMVLGACLSAGVPLEWLREELCKLPVDGYSIEEVTIERSMIRAKGITIRIEDSSEHHRKHIHTSYRSIEAMVSGSGLSGAVKDKAHRVFGEIARAEGIIHGVPMEDVHFHEVGAVDSIVDVVGACICLDALGVEAIYTTPVRTGSGGFVTTQHGTMPIPTPATLEVLKGYPVDLTGGPYELTTPTGAGIVKALASGTLPQDATIRIESLGYGAGTREISEHPNLLRLAVGQMDTRMHEESLVLIETNIDDMNPEIFPYVIERLLAEGAHDAYIVPVIMKKGRPAHLLSVACQQSRLDSICAVLFRETTTTGVRILHAGRKKLDREITEVQTRFGKMAFKVVTLNGQRRFVPEFEECKRVALEFHLPLVEVYRQLEHDAP